MAGESIKVLLVEDSPVATAMVQGMLGEAGSSSFEMECVDCLSAGLKRLAVEGIDLVLLNLTLPDSEGFDTFVRTHAQAPDVPIIVLTGLDDESVATDAVHAGAQDYLVKGRVDGSLLVRSIRYAVERKRAEDDRMQREKLQAILEMAGAACHELNQPMQAVSGYAELLLRNVDENSPSHKYLLGIVEQVNRMKQVTRRLSNVAGYRTRTYLEGIRIIDLEQPAAEPQRVQIADDES